jgi:isoleucyl-tRNA synthetase
MSPFFAEALYNETKLFDKTPFESVHLSDWPKADKKIINKKLMKEMELIRDLAKEALKERALSKIKVRQPLLKLSINLLKLSQAKSLKNNKELIQILKEEINVKEIIFDNKIKNSIELDKHITSELYEEGILRELIRLIQDLRNRLNLKPQNKVKLFISSDNELLNILKRNEKIFKNEVNAKEINFKKVNKFNIELNTEIDNKNIWIGLIN